MNLRELSIQRPHVDLIFSRAKPGQNNQFVFIPPDGRWMAIQESRKVDKTWKSQVPEQWHRKVSSMLKRQQSASAGKLRGMVLFGQPLDCQDACEMLNGSKWVRTDRSENGLRSVYFPILDVIEFDKQVDAKEQCSAIYQETYVPANMTPPAYFEPKIKQSDTHGFGVFATRDYEEERVGCLMGSYAPDCTTVTGFQPNGKLSRHWSVYVNHDKDPHVMFNDDRSITLLRQIKKGEEFFVDYGSDYWKDKLRIKDKEVVDALLTSPSLRTPTQKVYFERFKRCLTESEIRYMKQMDPEYQLTQIQKKKRKLHELVVDEHLIQGLKLKDEKWLVYWPNQTWPTMESFEAVSHLTDLVSRCQQFKGVVQYKVSQIPLIAPDVAPEAEQKVFQGADYFAVNCVANAVKLSEEWYKRLKQELGKDAFLAQLLTVCRRKDCPVQIEKVKLHDELFYEFLRSMKSGKFLVEVQGIEGRHMLTWDAQRGKITSPHFPFEVDVRQEHNLTAMGITAKTVKVVTRVFLKNNVG